jgi:hypothetical protein
LLLHHLTALSQKGAHGSGVEQTILGAGPVLEVCIIKRKKVEKMYVCMMVFFHS